MFKNIFLNNPFYSVSPLTAETSPLNQSQMKMTNNYFSLEFFSQGRSQTELVRNLCFVLDVEGTHLVSLLHPDASRVDVQGFNVPAMLSCRRVDAAQCTFESDHQLEDWTSHPIRNQASQVISDLNQVDFVPKSPDFFGA